jgi:hypothetical protein
LTLPLICKYICQRRWYAPAGRSYLQPLLTFLCRMFFASLYLRLWLLADISIELTKQVVVTQWVHGLHLACVVDFLWLLGKNTWFPQLFCSLYLACLFSSCKWHSIQYIQNLYAVNTLNFCWEDFCCKMCEICTFALLT